MIKLVLKLVIVKIPNVYLTYVSKMYLLKYKSKLII